MNIDYVARIDDNSLEALIDSAIQDETMIEVHSLFRKTIDPWVPMLEGPLHDSVEVTPEYIRYVQPYAHYQYMGTEFNHTTEFHPLASAKWDKVAMETKGEEFTQQVAEIIKRRLAQNG